MAAAEAAIFMNDPLLAWRKEFPILAHTTYMISHSLGAMPRQVSVGLQQFADTRATRGIRAWEEGWWEMPVTGKAATEELARREILVDYRPQAGIRVAPHFYTTDEEVEHTVAQLCEIIAAQG
jgi:kynureninase